MKSRLLFFLSLGSLAVAATPIVPLNNDKVTAYEETLKAAEVESAGGGLPSITVFLSDGIIQRAPATGPATTATVRRGDVIFRGPHEGRITATGPTGIQLMRIEFKRPESKIAWGTSGFAPDYRMLVENGYARTYDIRIAAGKSEPMHSHHDRVVVCLSGAQLRHVLADGQQQDSSLETGQCLWRLGQTHVGNNIGKTDLWVIAIEPK
jgi:hypothetical protein